MGVSMQNYESVGKLKNPPLVYTAGFVFINLQNIHEYIRKIQDKLRDEYPGSSTLEVVISEVDHTGRTADREIKHYVFNDPDLNWGLVLTENRLILQTIQYEHFKDFGERFQKAINIFHEVTRLKYHSGIAFRQVDRIPLPKESEPSDIITDKFLPPKFPQIEATVHAFSRQEHMVSIEKDTSLIIRTYSFAEKQGAHIPNDLVPLRLALNPDLMNKPPHDSPLIMADFEVIRNMGGKSEPFNSIAVIEEMNEFHQFASLAFRAVITPEELNRRKEK
ncbi:MAG: TIGR04255 family protein [Alphaproteobacteria bacterium]|nr:MAG: TIGR04255 family protein [Alphaproteobacteria bacterium]